MSEAGFWREHWGLPPEGLGTPNLVIFADGETTALFPQEQWVPGVWASMEGARITTARHPEGFATIKRVDLTKRALVFDPSPEIIRAGEPLYFFDPNWKPNRFTEIVHV